MSRLYNFSMQTDKILGMHTLMIDMHEYHVAMPSKGTLETIAVPGVRVYLSFPFDTSDLSILDEMHDNQSVMEWTVRLPRLSIDSFFHDLHAFIIQNVHWTSDGKSRAAKLFAVCPAMYSMVTHPITHKSQAMPGVIVSLNDKFKWTRDQIAEWLESLDIDISMEESE